MQTKGNCLAYVTLAVVLAAAAPQAAGEDISVRIGKAVAVLKKLDDCRGICLQPEQFAGVDCAAVIPGFYRGAAVAGEVFDGGLLLETSFGRGFISCRLGNAWSAPTAVTMTGGSRAIQIGQNLDVVILGMNAPALSRPLPHRFAIDLVASPAIANANSVRANPEIKILIVGGAGKTLDGIDLQGVILKQDKSVNKALYGQSAKIATPAGAQPLVSKLSDLFRR
jgi:lipid-binding SYLF domain-containing protein